MIKLILFLFLSIIYIPCEACLILFLKDGNNILVGNHEDWFAQDAAIKINPPTSNKLGSVVFTFASEGWAQGGMNEKGLFFDGTYTPYQHIYFSSDKKEYPGYIWQAILDKFSSVDDAIDFIQNFKLPGLKDAHVFIADAKGNSALIGIDKGKLAIKKNNANYQLQTNFNPWNPELSEEPVCKRYKKTESMLSINSVANINNLKSILQETHQNKLTVYSNIYDLKNKKIFTYNKTDFNNPVEINLPEIFKKGKCMSLLESVFDNEVRIEDCISNDQKSYELSGKIIDQDTGKPLVFSSIGIEESNYGTISDPDGSFILNIPVNQLKDSITISAIGYKRIKIKASLFLKNRLIKLKPESTVLKEVTIKDEYKYRIERMGWMKGKDGIIPLDTLQGGGAVAMFMEAPKAPFYFNRIMMRLLYNSKEEAKFRFHVFEYDSLNDCPGEELLYKEIILKQKRKHGWLRFDIADKDITINNKKFFIGFEWLDDIQTRNQMIEGLKDWSQWKKSEYAKGNSKVKLVDAERPNGEKYQYYKYHGNMMNWPGWNSLPPFTGLMIQTGKVKKTEKLRTFERKTSFGKWEEKSNTLNAVVYISY